MRIYYDKSLRTFEFSDKELSKDSYTYIELDRLIHGYPSVLHVVSDDLCDKGITEGSILKFTYQLNNIGSFMILDGRDGSYKKSDIDLDKNTVSDLLSRKVVKVISNESSVESIR